MVELLLPHSFCGTLKNGTQKLHQKSAAKVRSSEKGVGGQKGLARGDPSCARDSDLFSVPFSLYATLRIMLPLSS